MGWFEAVLGAFEPVLGWLEPVLGCVSPALGRFLGWFGMVLISKPQLWISHLVLRCPIFGQRVEQQIAGAYGTLGLGLVLSLCGMVVGWFGMVLGLF